MLLRTDRFRLFSILLHLARIPLNIVVDIVNSKHNDVLVNLFSLLCSAGAIQYKL
jgi:hypothetical protein